MQISTGLFDHMVLQRNSRNRSEARVTGTTSATGQVRARVTAKKRPVAGFAGKTVGKAGAGRFEATLAGIPVGGP